VSVGEDEGGEESDGTIETGTEEKTGLRGVGVELGVEEVVSVAGGGGAGAGV
jgi:hypothetical protein